jgi:hypothetical protein
MSAGHPTQTPSGIEDLVCGDIARRQPVGIAKYGQTLAANPLPLSAWLEHAYQEALDLALYLRRAMHESDRGAEALHWHLADQKPDSDITVLCWAGDCFFTGYWDDGAQYWVDCSSGGEAAGVTHWAEPAGPAC